MYSDPFEYLSAPEFARYVRRVRDEFYATEYVTNTADMDTDAHALAMDLHNGHVPASYIFADAVMILDAMLDEHLPFDPAEHGVEPEDLPSYLADCLVSSVPLSWVVEDPEAPEAVEEWLRDFGLSDDASFRDLLLFARYALVRERIIRILSFLADRFGFTTFNPED